MKASQLKDEEESYRRDEKQIKPEVNRRKFLKGATVAAALAAIPLEPLFGGKGSRAEASVIDYEASIRSHKSFQFRVNTAKSEKIDIGTISAAPTSSRFSLVSRSH